ncbi:MAG: hypothetical protein ACNS63_03375 [Candidatus Nitrospinota bacterium M3_3B_026]
MSEKDPRRSALPARRKLTDRIREDGFTYSFGAYPEGEYCQKAGYDSKYLREEGCFHYHIAVPHERLMATFLSLLGRLPEMVHLVVKIHSDDYYRDHDTYISDSLINRREIVEWIKNWRDVVLDDGFFGIGAFSHGSPAEVFLDEHKTIQVYHHDPDMMERALERMGIPFVMELGLFLDEPHYHEPLPLDEENGDDYLTAFEDLADRYDLYLDEEEDEEIDEDGVPIGMTCWKVDIRGYKPGLDEVEKPRGFYSTLYVNAESRKDVIEQVESYLGYKEEEADLYLQMARVPPELLTSEITRENPDPDKPGVWYESERIVFDWGRL